MQPHPIYHTLTSFSSSGSEMVREKYLQTIIDIVKTKGCATRRYIIELLQMNLNLTAKQAEYVVDDIIYSLVRRNVVVRRGRGVYCWAGPP
jgi:dimeric dUTPase (all-alpha-NTP-PPase superfamily)